MRLLIALAFALAATAAQAGDFNVFAAASLKTALDQVIAASPVKGAKPVYGATNALAKQIEEGAPADIFMSADTAWMDELAAKNLIKADTRKNLLGNTLVLVAAADNAAAIDINNIAAGLNSGKLAVAEVNSVPAGKYAKAALEKTGQWQALEPSLAMAANVRAALQLVATGEAPLGIVYGSDAKAEKGVKIAAEFPAGTHPPIVYPVAILAGSASPDAQAFLAYLESPGAAKIFEANGFTVLK